MFRCPWHWLTGMMWHCSSLLIYTVCFISVGILISLEQGPSASHFSAWHASQPHGSVAISFHAESFRANRTHRQNTANVPESEKGACGLCCQWWDYENMAVLWASSPGHKSEKLHGREHYLFASQLSLANNKWHVVLNSNRETFITAFFFFCLQCQLLLFQLLIV